MRHAPLLALIASWLACDDPPARHASDVTRATDDTLVAEVVHAETLDATDTRETSEPPDSAVALDTDDALHDAADSSVAADLDVPIAPPDSHEPHDTHDTTAAELGPETSSDTSTDTGAETSDADTSDRGEVVAPPPAGTPDDPIAVSRWPFVVSGDTATSRSDSLDRYGCAPNTDESGPELVYRFDLEAAGSFVAELAESSGVDVDLHLLAHDPISANPSAVACLARANTRLTRELGPGRYWLVVDTYVASSGPRPGPFRLALEHTVLDAWLIVPVAPGVVWRQKVYADYAGGRQTINVLDVDLAHPAVSIRPHGGDGCIRPSRVGPAEGAVAAINAGFFDTGPGTCPPLDLIKIEGELVATNRLTGSAQRSFGVTPAGAPLMAWVAANADWPAAWSAIGGHPSLVTAGAAAVDPDRDTSFYDSRHPRTALGLTAGGHLLLVTVDGRGPAGVGMTMDALAQHLVNLGVVDGFNLDGGGSTAMWIADQSLTGLVNYPSDGDGVTHTGDRAVSDVLLVFSTP